MFIKEGKLSKRLNSLNALVQDKMSLKSHYGIEGVFKFYYP